MPRCSLCGASGLKLRVNDSKLCLNCIETNALQIKLETIEKKVVLLEKSLNRLALELLKSNASLIQNNSNENSKRVVSEILAYLLANTEISTATLMRKFHVSYSQATNIIETLEELNALKRCSNSNSFKSVLTVDKFKLLMNELNLDKG